MGITENILNLKKKMSGIIRKPYYFVEPCPNCGSFETGRYVKAHRDGVSEWMMDEALSNGELLCPLNEIPDNNLFCINCSHTWKGYPQLKFLTLDEINDEKKRRGTKEILNSRVMEKEQEAEKIKKSGITSRITSSVKEYVNSRI